MGGWIACGRVDGLWEGGWPVGGWMTCGRVDGLWEGDGLAGGGGRAGLQPVGEPEVWWEPAGRGPHHGFML